MVFLFSIYYLNLWQCIFIAFIIWKQYFIKQWNFNTKIISNFFASWSSTNLFLINLFFCFYAYSNDLCIHISLSCGQQRCAMATIWVPTYANIFVAKLDRISIDLFIKQISMFCLRLLDDKFIIRTKSKNELKNFTKDLNVKHPSIKSDFKYSKGKTEFLDTLHYKDQHYNQSIPFRKALRINIFNSSKICETFTSTYREICGQRIRQKNPSKPRFKEHLERSSLLNKQQFLKKDTSLCQWYTIRHCQILRK